LAFVIIKADVLDGEKQSIILCFLYMMHLTKLAKHDFGAA